MTMAKSKEEQIFVGIGEEVIELTGADKEAFVADKQAIQQAQALLEAEYKKKEEARKSALEKLAEIAGLTKDEMAALGL